MYKDMSSGRNLKYVGSSKLETYARDKGRGAFATILLWYVVKEKVKKPSERKGHAFQHRIKLPV